VARLERTGLRPNHYNEMFDEAGSLRGPYLPRLEAYRSLGEEEFQKKIGLARRRLEELNATFPVEDEPGNPERLVQVDWLPRIIAEGEWRTLSEGLLQRGRAINVWLRAVYGGGQDIVPEEIVRGSVFYRPHDLPGDAPPVHIYGPDVVHLSSGEYVVLEDNVRVPSGVAYSEAIRRAGMEAMPELYGAYRLAEIFSYYNRLREALELATPDGVEEPNIAVVTRGGEDPAFFEHSRIAEACGIAVLTLGDCRVCNGALVAREDGRRLNVIYRRFDEDYVDTDLPELNRVYLEGNVGFANALGVGVADDKAVFPYVPAMIERYLGETPILANAPTYSLAEDEARAQVLERLPEMVIKPREGYGGQGLVVGPEARSGEIDAARRKIRKDPTQFVAQETLDFSTHLLKGEADGAPDEVFVDLRAFVLPVVGYLKPGGLTRVAKPGTRVVNSTAGGSCKDTWVLEG
jgi:uncharacterized circularly permuted ATP-grasp superfamily protein